LGGNISASIMPSSEAIASIASSIARAQDCKSSNVEAMLISTLGSMK